MKKNIKLGETARRWLRFIPNGLTLCNSLCGFAAILYTLQVYDLGIGNHKEKLGVFCVSAIMIFSAMIFDAFDGLAARALNAASMHGVQMDSLADMVTFGVAPATIVAIMTHSLKDGFMPLEQEAVVYLLSSVYLGCAALRLATYNVHAMMPEKKGNPNYFSGLPSPGAAAALCVAILFMKSRFGTDEAVLKQLGVYLVIFAAVLGLLMTSTIPYIHAGKWLMSIRRNRKKLPIVLVMIAVVVCFRMDGLAFLTASYIASGPILLLFELGAKKKNIIAEEEK